MIIVFAKKISTILSYSVSSMMLFLSSSFVFATPSTEAGQHLDLTQHWVGFSALAIFIIAYMLVVVEEKIQLSKSKPIMASAGIIWIIIAILYAAQSDPLIVTGAIRHNFLEYTELFFFLLVAMTYVNAMMERGVFDALRQWLVARGYSYRSLFWLTGLLAFFISPLADNLTTSLIMCAVVMSVANGNNNYVGVSCVNIVVAANAGGAFSPFGDITTLMVWQKGLVQFSEFLYLLLPSLVNWLVPAAILHFSLPKGYPGETSHRGNLVKVGGLPILGLFILTVLTTSILHAYFHLPPVFGMMTGLAYLKLYGYSLRVRSHAWHHGTENPPGSANKHVSDETNPYDFDVFAKVAHAEWDTLFFFYGVILSVGGLGFIGYLAVASEFFYGNLGPLNANIIVGLLSAIVDNIPVMFSVLSMEPDMSLNQWLLVTLTAGVGGSLLSVGSASGVALMGQARGKYTFLSHLRWTPVIALGYFASIAVHLLVNGT
jgi:Na+/H+ antiporter NhaD/arsenite permease-like protein